MIVHKTFTKQTAGLRGKAALGNREKLRQKIEEFVRNEIDEEDVVTIAETATTVGGLLSVTVWYMKR